MSPSQERGTTVKRVRAHAKVMAALTVGGLLWTAPAHAAISSRPSEPSRSRVERDCQAHRGTLTRPYSGSELRRTSAALRRRGLEYQDCGQAIASQTALSDGRSGRRQARAVVSDCLRHGGRLTYRFSRETLERALRNLPRAVRDETRCQVGMISQRNAQRGSRRPFVRTRAPQPGRSPTRTPEQTEKAAGAFLAPFRRDAEGHDRPAGRVIAIAQAENEYSAREGHPSGLDVTRAREIGRSRTTWTIPGNGFICSGLLIGDVAAALACGDPKSVAERGALAITRTPGGVTIWGPLPDGVRTIKITTDAGRTVNRSATDNGIRMTLARVPSLVAYRGPTGRQHYIDYTDIICLPGRPCGPPRK